MANKVLQGGLDTILQGFDLNQEQMQLVIGEFLTGTADFDLMRAFLVALSQKGESIDELVGAAQAMRDSMIRIQCAKRPVADTCGTGGDGSKTFNISTAAAIVAAAAGLTVAKHGNRKVTSATGSADVLAELGINLDAGADTVQRCLNELNLCFCFAPRFHPAMRHIAEVRKSIPHPTIFNRLGPLCNPANAECQVLGVGDAKLQHKLACTLQRLGTVRSIVVRGDDGVDELSLSCGSHVIEVTADELTNHQWHPHDFGLEVADRGALFADDPMSSAACIREVLEGKPGPRRDAVILNAAGALWVAGVAQDLHECARRAEEAVDQGSAFNLTQRLGAFTHQG
jgi:anthranilate phosphoribosyltransferase